MRWLGRNGQDVLDGVVPQIGLGMRWVRLCMDTQLQARRARRM